MWLPRRKKREKELDRKEAQIQAIHNDTLRKIDKASKSAEKLNNLIKDQELTVTEMIFLATGGNRRHGGKSK